MKISVLYSLLIFVSSVALAKETPSEVVTFAHAPTQLLLKLETTGTCNTEIQVEETSSSGGYIVVEISRSEVSRVGCPEPIQIVKTAKLDLSKHTGRQMLAVLSSDPTVKVLKILATGNQ